MKKLAAVAALLATLSACGEVDEGEWHRFTSPDGGTLHCHSSGTFDDSLSDFEIGEDCIHVPPAAEE